MGVSGRIRGVETNVGFWEGSFLRGGRFVYVWGIERGDRGSGGGRLVFGRGRVYKIVGKNFFEDGGRRRDGCGGGDVYMRRGWRSRVFWGV